MPNPENLTLGELLLKKGLITGKKLQEAADLQKKTGERIGRILLQKGFVTPRVLYAALEEQLGVEFARSIAGKPDPGVFRDLPEDFCRANQVVAVRMPGGKLRVFVSDPMNQALINQLAFLTGGEAAVEYATEEAVAACLERGASRKAGGNKTASSSAVRYLQDLLSEALRLKVSDVHLESLDKSARALFRKDGVLKEEDTVPRDLFPSVISRIKILSELDISEKRLPQDGRFTFASGHRTADIRVSILPSVHGENAVLRVLDQGGEFLTLDRIGFPPALLDLLRKESRKPQGMILVTGPTGSGKTTSLYALLDHVRRAGNRKILAIEDPVEYRIDGITQVQAHPDIGLSFAAGLRSFLRHDPDVMLVGEIRDRETAEIALRAALTGHLVLSTLHTNDAASTLIRFTDMGIPAYLLPATVSLVIAQRLVRKVCPKCRVLRKPAAAEFAQYGLRGFMKPSEKISFAKGCKACGGTGYRGRVPVFEWLKITEAVKSSILSGESVAGITRAAARGKMPRLKDSVVLLVRAGVTTPEEAARITTLGD